MRHIAHIERERGRERERERERERARARERERARERNTHTQTHTHTHTHTQTHTHTHTHTSGYEPFGTALTVSQMSSFLEFSHELGAHVTGTFTDRKTLRLNIVWHTRPYTHLGPRIRTGALLCTHISCVSARNECLACTRAHAHIAQQCRYDRRL